MWFGSYGNNQINVFVEIILEEEPENYIEIICNVISHEFIHYILERDISDDASLRLDMIPKEVLE
ncbi:MAG: hypothetical protein ACTSWR_07900 [Candidatus Helarchaeota archaeon]